MDKDKCDKNVFDSVIIASVGSGKTNWSKYLDSRNDDFIYYGGEFNGN